jgi:hypothetical protein
VAALVLVIGIGRDTAVRADHGLVADPSASRRVVPAEEGIGPIRA